ncbi:MAG: SOS response-associated peptidase [Deltaproteobacteria bacterium]|nr:SOS response-associated peptidase [Deltaproteobacteria bacterium]
MCGRFTLTVATLSEVARSIGAIIEPGVLEAYRPRYNVGPTSRHFVARLVEGRRELIDAEWGLVTSWAASRPGATRPINARSETAAEKPTFRAAFRSRRCVVPVDGFYEWRGPKGAREPVRFHAPDARILWLAGLYESFTMPTTGEVMTTFALLTTEANDVVRPVHDRMPVLLDGPGIAGWLSDRPFDLGALRALLRPAPASTLEARPASRRLNVATIDEPSLLEPDPAPAQLRLFG